MRNFIEIEETLRGWMDVHTYTWTDGLRRVDLKMWMTVKICPKNWELMPYSSSDNF